MRFACLCESASDAKVRHVQQHARKIDETRTRISEDERRDRAAQLQRTMKLLVHASDCRDKSCASSNCHKIKELYYHANKCTVKVLGGCPACRCAAASHMHPAVACACACPGTQFVHGYFCTPSQCRHRYATQAPLSSSVTLELTQLWYT